MATSTTQTQKETIMNKYKVTVIFEDKSAWIAEYVADDVDHAEGLAIAECYPSTPYDVICEELS